MKIRPIDYSPPFARPPEPFRSRRAPLTLAGVALLVLAPFAAACSGSAPTSPGTGTAAEPSDGGRTPGTSDGGGTPGTSDGGAPLGTSDAGPAPVDIDTYYAETAVQGCQKSFDCCGTTGDDPIISHNWQGSVTTKQGCPQAVVPSVLQQDLAARKTEIADGTTVYHGDSAKACIDAKNAQSCTLFFDNPDDHAPDACKHVFEGKLALGATCTLSGQCAGGAECIGNPTNGYTCRTVPSLGQACTNFCPTGLFCDASSVSPRCVAQKPEGAACDPTALQCLGICDYTKKTCGPPFAPACVGK